MHQVPGITYWWSNSFVRVQSFTYYAPFITYTFNKWNAAPGTRHYQPWFSNICSWSGALKYMHIYIYLVGSPPLFCAEEAFLTLSATATTYHVQHIIHIIPGMCTKNVTLTEMVTTTSTSCTFDIYVRMVMYTRHTHWYNSGDSHNLYKYCWIIVIKYMKNCHKIHEKLSFCPCNA